MGRPDRDAEHQQARLERSHLHELAYDRAVLAYSVVRSSRAATTRRTGWPASRRRRPASRTRTATFPFECATIAEVLGERGWNTYMLGKWHLVAADEMNMASTKRNWPVGRGFERYYGFLGGETNQWYPDLIYDNHPVDQPAMPEDGYHLTTDLTDKAIEFVRDAKMLVPDKPFFMYFCPGATHAPHHAPKEWIERYAGKFDMGYEALPRARVRAPEAAGDLPGGRRAHAAEPLRGGDERRRQALERGRRRPALGLAVRRGEAALQPDGRGLRGLPLAHGPRDRPAARLPRGDRASSRTRSSCSSPTTARAARAAPTAR